MKKIHFKKVGTYALGTLACIALVAFSSQVLINTLDNFQHTSALKSCASKIPDTDKAISTHKQPMYDTDSDTFWGYQKIQDTDVQVGYDAYPAFDKCMAEKGQLRS